MGYGFEFPAYQLGGSKIVWVMGEYGLLGLWVMRELTVLVKCQFGQHSTSHRLVKTGSEVSQYNHQ
ncbi:hypothetical protein L208DRAFT_1339936 [Tricholoma matsutake]|nr:hypothetical protein L208DRAFT_1339936 [Tricholoma matsutake 945]